MAAQDPPRHLLQRAFNHARSGTGRWPVTLDEALQVLHLRVCLSGIARNLARADPVPGEQRAALPPPVQRTRPAPAVAPTAPHRTRPQRDLFDARRAAANDRDED